MRQTTMLNEWSSDQVASWRRGLGLKVATKSFDLNVVDGEVLYDFAEKPDNDLNTMLGDQPRAEHEVDEKDEDCQDR